MDHEPRRHGRPLHPGQRLKPVLAALTARRPRTPREPASRSRFAHAGQSAALIEHQQARARRPDLRLVADAATRPSLLLFDSAGVLLPRRDRADCGLSIDLEVPLNTITAVSAHPLVSHRGEARSYAGNLFEFVIPAAATAGLVSLLRMTCRPGGEPPRHAHSREDAVSYVLDGDVCFEIAPRRQVVPAPPCGHRGTYRGFRFKNPVVHMLALLTPGGVEDMFRTFSVPAAERALPPKASTCPTSSRSRRTWPRGIEIVGPPVGREG
jgi:hypothetical protein